MSRDYRIATWAFLALATIGAVVNSDATGEMFIASVACCVAADIMKALGK